MQDYVWHWLHVLPYSIAFGWLARGTVGRLAAGVAAYLAALGTMWMICKHTTQAALFYWRRHVPWDDDRLQDDYYADLFGQFGFWVVPAVIAIGTPFLTAWLGRRSASESV